MDYSYRDLTRMIDHSLLVPTLAVADLERGCRLALAYDVASVCIVPYYVACAAQQLAGSEVVLGTTIGFPHGGHTTAAKVAEAKQALRDSATELDMVVNLSQVLSGRWDYVRNDIAAVVEIAHDAGAKVKVIFENCYLQDEHKIRLCEICGNVGADWVKTSTGFGTGGATDTDLMLMRRCSPPHVQVKAAGGVRSLDRLLEVRALGCTRAGATQTAAILDEAKRRLSVK